MKLECPYCWQHYDIDRKHLNQEFTCISCAQVFNGKNALIIEDDPKRGRTFRLITYIILLTAVLLLGISNLSLWKQLRSFQSRAETIARTEKSETVQRLEVVHSAASALEERLAKLEKILAVKDESLKSAEAHAEALEKRLKENPDVLAELEKIRTVQTGIFNQLKKLDLQDAAMLKGLADFRSTVNAMNLPSRIGELEKSAMQNEVQPLVKRLNDLEVKVKALEK